MSEEHSQYRVLQNGNPFADAIARLAPREIELVVDVGANVGDVCVHMLANFPQARIHAFEPDVECHQALAARFTAEPRVIPVQLGLSDRKTRKTLFRYEESGLNSFSALAGSSQQYLAGYGVQSAGSQEAELVTLDEYCRERQIGRIDFLKLDIQGWELHCLRGAKKLLTSGQIGAVYAEVNFVPLYEQQIYYEDVARQLRDFGFRLFNLYALSYSQEGQLCWADALFLKDPELPIKKPSLIDRLMGR